MSMRNMAAMFGAMALLRRIDQEEPLVLLYVRIGYLVYVAVTAGLYILLHFRIIARRDTTLIEVPIASKTPSFSEAMEQARKAAEKAEAEKRRELEGEEASTTSTVTQATSSNNNDNETEEQEEDKNKTEKITIMEYDLRHLANARRSWVTSSCFLAAVHYHMQSVSPLFMSGIMGVIRLITEDPLVQIHLRGAPAVDKLSRPFTPEKNPLATMLKDLAPKDENSPGAAVAATTSTTTPGQIQNAPNANGVEDDLHDDGDDDDDDDQTPDATNANSNDDHIKSDFDDEDTETTGESKKDQ